MSLSNHPACKLCIVGSSVALYSQANQLLKDLMYNNSEKEKKIGNWLKIISLQIKLTLAGPI